MFISPTQALKSYDISKPTLYADMKKGKLSFKTDDRGKRKIDVSELDRIYEKKPDENKEKKALNNVKEDKSETLNTSNGAAQVEIKYLKKMLDDQKNLYESEINNLRESLKMSQEGHNRATLLLEHKNDNNDNALEKVIVELKDKVIVQEKTTIEKLEGLAKEKANVEKENKLFKVTGLILVCVAIGVTIFALLEQGIIQLN